MAVKILLADKSITIQKVVEMLFSGREYQVTCVSDGETALSEAARVVPDVILADVDLPRVDGYSYSARLKDNPTLAQTPVVLMLGRDDVFDAARARQSGVIDHILKPFESQELIGKVKKALQAAPPRLAEPAPPPPPKPAAQKQQAPSDIFDIIREAPAHGDIRRPAAPARDESVFEVEPVVEIEEPGLPTGPRAVDEIREGLGLGGPAKPSFPPEITSFDTLDMATGSAKEYMPPKPAPPSGDARPEQWEPPREATPAATALSEDMLRGVTEETVGRIAREVIEKVAWEVIPDLAERLIREEIERLKAGA